MKNLTSFIVVLCLLIILGCKCQSDLFDFGKTRNGNVGNQSSQNSILQTGTYSGKGKNETYNQTGDFLLRIDSVDSDGNVKGYFEAPNVLQGTADLNGTIGKDGKLRLNGTLDGKRFAIFAVVSGSTLDAGFALFNKDSKEQSGTFKVTRR